jgi:hypothetical protein
VATIESNEFVAPEFRDNLPDRNCSNPSKESMLDTKRREFIALLGAGGLLLAVKVRRGRAQQPAMPVIGFLNSGSAHAFAQPTAMFRRGLSEAGYVEGRNVTIEYRWAEGEFQRFASLAYDLIQTPPCERSSLA